MTGELRLIAPAKINWTLEALRIRPDGYHEIRSILQTIALHDSVTLTDADDISLEIEGAPVLAEAPPETNLAYRAAAVMRERMGRRPGVRIRLEKRIPVAAGLGGGSSDAAAVLRGLNELWSARQTESNLAELAGEIGSDPPFFVVGGTAAVSGRGEAVEPLPDALASDIILAIPREHHRGEKTAAMFGALTPASFTEGEASDGVREVVLSGRMITDGVLENVFERVTRELQPATELAMDALRTQGYAPHLAGAGPSFFLLYAGGADVADLLADRIRELGFDPLPTHVLSRAEALRMRGG